MNKLIFSGARAGTKLLADIYQQQGYHNFGEFLNTYSADIINDKIPYAVRMNIDAQKHIISKEQKYGTAKDNFHHSLLIKQRYELFKSYAHITPSIVTVWYTSLKMAPETFNIINNREILCLRRKNKFEQILSKIVTDHNLNYDGEVQSEKVKIFYKQLKSKYYFLKHIESCQDYFVANNMGRIIYFDDLISGKADLNFQYKVTTTDQHKDIKDFIINYEQAQELFQTILNEDDMY